MSFDIDIDHLGIEELEALNARIIERLKLLDRIRAQQAMMALNLGTQVSFDSSRHGRVFGTIIKFNRKTVAVLTEDGRQWRVPPHILTPIKDATPKQRFVYANEITQVSRITLMAPPMIGLMEPLKRVVFRSQTK